ncbi:hypothetical protein B0H63DRAFT_518901 [Podospora didyma]|uniref:C-type lectin domain-containing protein n=1 Tax=Podospora didyma TaxID=330526 RepID=A0AAE0U3X2_9PEZI|nr:hypothetical protein B0H63DRAFT_518901 [Podospora didyma]
MRVSAVFAVASAFVAAASASGFHILTANCVEKEFSKRGSVSRFEISADAHREDAEAFETGENSINPPVSLEERGKGGGDKPANWHESGRRSTANLMPSNQYGCDWLQKHEALSYSTLPDGSFSARNFCGHNLDFYKKENKWEVWENNANPGKKYGECYEDLSTFDCNLWVGFYQEKCHWSRRWVCAIPIC